jgi:thioredoxin 1
VEWLTAESLLCGVLDIRTGRSNGVRMTTKDLTATEFVEVTSGKGITLVDFWAEWCGPCHRFAPVFEKVSENHPDITFAKIDTEAEQSLAAEFQIYSIPTIMAIRDGVVVYQQAGALPEHLLENLISKVRELDMEEVRSAAA